MAEQTDRGAMEEQAVHGAMVEWAVQCAMAEQAVQEAMAGWPPWPWPRHSARPLQPETYSPPKKNSWGRLRVLWMELALGWAPKSTPGCISEPKASLG